MKKKTVAREGLLVLSLVGGWFALLPILAFFFYSPHEGGPIHLAGLLSRDLFVDRRSGVWILVLAPYVIFQLVRVARPLDGKKHAPQQNVEGDQR
jgi:hypothetical protein